MTKLSIIIELPPNKNLQKISQNLKQMFPEITDLIDEYHVTIGVADDLHKEDIDKIVSKLKPILSTVRLTMKINSLDDLENHKNEGIIFGDVQCDGLEDLHWETRKLLESYGGKFTFPDFVAHMTLAYLPKKITSEQKKSYSEIAIDEEFEITAKNIKISIKDGDDWVKIAKQLLSKRELP